MAEKARAADALELLSKVEVVPMPQGGTVAGKPTCS